jgi:hypothetical protein
MWEIGLVHTLNVKHPRFEEETVTGEFLVRFCWRFGAWPGIHCEAE